MRHLSWLGIEFASISDMKLSQGANQGRTTVHTWAFYRRENFRSHMAVLPKKWTVIQGQYGQRDAFSTSLSDFSPEPFIRGAVPPNPKSLNHYLACFSSSSSFLHGSTLNGQSQRSAYSPLISPIKLTESHY
jgi:hypothetical protein